MSRWCRMLFATAVGLTVAVASGPLLAVWGLSPAMVVSVSSDGHYAVSSHADNELVLWDLEAREHRLVADNANIYSAYFIEGREAFLWQDLSNTVRVQTVSDEPLLEFVHAPTYGHVIDRELRHYVASDEDWRLTVGHGQDQQSIKDDGVSPGFQGIGKLLNLTIASEDGLLLSAGRALRGYDTTPVAAESPIEPEAVFSDYAGVVLWDLDARKPLHKFPGNTSKTYATLSAEGEYVLSGDENSLNFLWRATTGERLREYADLYGGHYDHDTKTFDDSRLIPRPEDLETDAILAVRFLDNEHFVQIPTYSHYAVLFHRDDPFPLRYLDLGVAPRASTRDYDRNAAIDSAPAANLLVTGQQSSGGINVYRFAPESQTLERIWAPTP